MARAVIEFQSLLASLADELATRIQRLLASLADLDQADLLTVITDTAPALITPFLTAAADLTAIWYEDQNPESDYVAAPVDVVSLDELAASARWAALQDNPADALAGAANNALFKTSRETVATNADAEGVKWARFARADACGFCRLLATRGYVYKSEDAAQAVSHKDAAGHSRCRCTAYPERGGPAIDAAFLAQYKALLKQWDADYKAARREAGAKAGSIANAMDYAPGGRRYKGDDAPPRQTRPRKPVNPDKPKARTAPAAPQQAGDSEAAVARRLLPGLRDSLAALRAQGLPESSPQIQYHLTTIDRLSRQLQAS